METRFSVESPTPFNERTRLEAAYSAIVKPYDEADRNTLFILSEEYPECLEDAASCVELLRNQYKGEFAPANVSTLLRRANGTAVRMDRRGAAEAEAWHPFSEFYNKYHGTLEERQKIQPGTSAYREQELRASIFDSALYVVAQTAYGAESSLESL